MKTVFKSAMIASVATLGLSLAACGGTAEEAADEGDAMAEAVEAEAPAMEDAEMPAEESEEAMAEETEGADDAMEEAGEAEGEAEEM